MGDAVTQIKCKLQSYTTTPEPRFDKATAEECHQGHGYPHNFNYHRAEVARLSSAENFNCEAAKISFLGKRIFKEPEQPVTSEDYKEEEPFAHSMNYDSKELPFEFCKAA